MKIKLKKKQTQYAQVHVNLLRNKELSLKAKGLGAVLESYSNDFEVSLKSIELNGTDGIKSIRSAIKELEEGYYLFRFQTRDEAGLFETYWAFDSQQLDVEYLHGLIRELEKVELITKNDILERGTPHGNAVTGMPSAGCRQSTTYNNSNNQTSNTTTTTQYKEKAKEYGLDDEFEFEFEFEKFKNFNNNDPKKINLYYWNQWLTQWQINEVEKLNQLQKGAYDENNK